MTARSGVRRCISNLLRGSLHRKRGRRSFLEDTEIAMSDPLNPQAREMADESMVRTLSAQAEAIWPQEQPLFARYSLPADASVLDAGCGTGEISMRLAQMFDRAR